MSAIHYNRHGDMPYCAERASKNARSFAIQGVTCTRCISWARKQHGERPTDAIDDDIADELDDFDPGPYRERDQLAWMW